MTIVARTEVASTALRRLAATLRDRQRVNRQIGTALNGWVFRNFQNEGRELYPEGWAPLATATILARLRKGRGSRARRSEAADLVRGGASSRAVFEATGVGLLKILQDTGHLRNSFAPFSDNDQAGVGARSASDHADLALVHQFGSAARNIPARPMLPPPEVALEIAIKAYDIFIHEARQGARL